MASHKAINCVNPKYYIVANTSYSVSMLKQYRFVSCSFIDSTNGKCLCKYLPLASLGAGAFAPGLQEGEVR